MKCPHYTAGMCGDPALEAGATWCCSRWDCQTKADARTLHLQNLHSIANGGDRHAYRVYMAQVAGAEGAQSAEILKQAFIQSRAKT